MRLYRLVVIETVYDAEAAHLMYVITFTSQCSPLVQRKF